MFKGGLRVLRAVRNKFNVLFIDGAIQRTHPGWHAAREEDHSDGHCRLRARQVRKQEARILSGAV